MTPTMVLKCRVDQAMKLEAAGGLGTEESYSRRNLMNADHGTVTYRHETEDDAVQLLLSMSDIVTKEIKNNAFAFDDEGDHYSRDDSSRCSNDTNEEEHLLLTPREMNQSPSHHDTEEFNWTRVRTVSIDSPLHSCLLTPRPMDEDLQKHCSLPLIRPVLISPQSTPIGRGRPLRRASLKFAQKVKQEHIKLPKLPQLPPVTFSWKNYPELEAFLIANREEYLRHSALNYTVQQKQYNNRLTEQLL
eukprot:CAMPEP_0170340442 /NCGR_PEP_ID=MMETSP0116_2-20130129/71327_1 /TAXON_ID=400756 /ORGANISM="Durinskia baltica, Strain CSIRO CS-38" /LENGTH=245 /DNA_ID=CAMNT_0010593957 /DNA_START=62 /DNA_END=796 /DNA_ORIENTATION=+